MDSLRLGDPDYVGRYRLLGRLGAGGMGQVFLGVSPGGRQVAVKLIRADHIGMAQFRERFTREIEAARRVGGFHTAMVVDADPYAEPPWMATAYIQGPSLEDAVRGGGPLDPRAVRALGAGLAEGLDAIHACDLVHRDLKPGNVILAHDGPRIIGFGIARAVGAQPVTTPGAVVGTYAYMSPEQVRGHPIGPPSDVFSLGSTLAFAAAGRPPFGTEPIEAVLYRITREPPDLRGVPEDHQFRQLIAVCLAKAPAQRPTLTQILATLGDPAPAPAPAPAAQGATEPLAPPPPRQQTSRQPPSRQPQTAILPGPPLPARPPARARRGRTWKLAAAATALVVLAVAVLLLVLHPSKTPGTTVPVRLAGVYSASQYGFNMPYWVAVDSRHAWVTNGNSDSVTELDTGTGAWIQTLSGGRYGFSQPVGIVDDGTHIWVTNTRGNSVTELNASDGALVQTLSGGPYGFDGPQIITDDGTHLWVGNAFGDSLTELDASTGAWIRTLSGSGYGFSYPLGIAFDGTHIWVTNFQGPHGNSVTEVDAGSGRWMRTLSGGGYRFNQPAGIVVTGTHVWITNPHGNSVTEIDATDGRLIRTLSGGGYRFSMPSGIGIYGTHILITNISGNSMDELDAASGSLQQIVSGPSYHFDSPNSLAIAGDRVWIGNWHSQGGHGSVTELALG
jgi:serine/threonine protein kinase